MKSKLILLVSVVLFLCACPVTGTIYLNDGLIHDIDCYTSESVYVDFSIPYMYTTVNWLDGGTMYFPCSLRGYEHSRINVCGGEIRGDIYSCDYSRLNILGGSIYRSIYSQDFSQVNMSGGKILDYLCNLGYSRANILGGEIHELFSYNSSQVDISGGSIGSVVSGNSSQVGITGGLIAGDMELWNEGIMQIFGYDFAVDGQPVDYGELTSIYGGSPNDDPLRHLTGTLLSGEFIDNYFRIGQDAKIVLIPEPTTLLLLGLGGLALRRRK